MTYLLFYLAAGCATMVVPLLFQGLEKEVSRSTASMYRTAWDEDAKWTETVVVEFVVPLIGYLLILIAWPALVCIKLLDMWKFRHLRSVPTAGRLFANFDPDAVRFFRHWDGSTQSKPESQKK